MEKRRIEQSPKGTRMLIGVGEEADIYYYLDGLLKDHIGRVVRGEEHYAPNTQKINLQRYRMHQIAHLLYPQYNLDVRGVDLEDGEMYSLQVVRSKDNLRDAVSRGLSRRKQRSELPMLPQAKAAAKEMAEGGVIVHTGFVNASVRGDEVMFFEVVNIVPDKAMTRLTEGYPADVVEKGRPLIDAFRLERDISDIELHLMLSDPKERMRILKDHGMERLETLYSRELGSNVNVEK